MRSSPTPAGSRGAALLVVAALLPLPLAAGPAPVAPAAARPPGVTLPRAGAPARRALQAIPLRESIPTSMAARTPVYFYSAAPAAGEGAAPVVFFSGEMGWGPLMQKAASRLVAGGHPVLGIDASDYFKKALPADAWAGEVRNLRAQVNRRARRPADAAVILAGFEYGAEMIPYVLARSGSDGVRGAVLIAPGPLGGVVLRIEDWLRQPPGPGEAFDVAEEARRMPVLPVVLIEGKLLEGAGPGFLCDTLRGPKSLLTVAGADRHFAGSEEDFLEALAGAPAFIEAGGAEGAAPGCFAPTPLPESLEAPSPDSDPPAAPER